MKSILIGCVETSYILLQKLIDLKADIGAVFTRRSSPFNSDFMDLTPICRKYNIPVYYAENINAPEVIKIIEKLSPDIGFCFGWSQLLKPEIYRIPRKGIIGFHPAKIPNNRGRHPIIWALVLGLQKTASTFFRVDEHADTGDILSQETVDISFKDTARTLMDKILKVASVQVSQFYPLLKEDKETYSRQVDLGNTWRKRSKIDGQIHFQMSSDAIYNTVRALSAPYPGAHFIYKGNEIKVWKADLADRKKEPNIEFGKVLEIENNVIYVTTYDGVLMLIEHELSELPEVGDYLL